MKTSTTLSKTGWTNPLLLMISLFLAVFLSPTPLIAEDITLIEAVSEVLDDNPEILRMKATTESAEASVISARSKLIPSISIIGDYARYEEPTLIIPMHNAPSPTSLLNFDETIYSGGVRITIPILNIPAYEKVKVSKVIVRATEAQERESQQRMISQVVRIFINSALIKDHLAQINGHIEVLNRRLQEALVQSNEGRTATSTVAELKASLSALISDRESLLTSREELNYHLSSLLGRNNKVNLDIPEFTTQPQLIDINKLYDGSSNIDESIKGPLVDSAENHYQAALAGYRTAKKSFSPLVNGYFSQTARSGSDLDFISEWSAGITVTIPIATGGERIAGLMISKAETEAAKQAYRSAVANSWAEIQSLYRQWESAKIRQELLQDAVLNQNLAVSAARLKYSEGRVSLSTLLGEEADLLTYQIKLQSAHYDQILAYVSSEAITGRLTVESIERLIKE